MFKCPYTLNFHLVIPVQSGLFKVFLGVFHNTI